MVVVFFHGNLRFSRFNQLIAAPLKLDGYRTRRRHRREFRDQLIAAPLKRRRRQDRRRAHKRGGGVVVPLEFSSGEDRYQREPAHDEMPERIFDSRLIGNDRVSARLRARIGDLPSSLIKG
jgi:hypothetical protein